MRAMEAGALHGHAAWRGSRHRRHRKPLAESHGLSGPLNWKADDHTMRIAPNY
jgi:hypothetical protein